MEPIKESSTNQFLTFTLEGDMFAVEISRIREVMEYTEITKVPRMPDHFYGVINLRGNIVSVLDLGMMLRIRDHKLESTSDKSCIIIIEIMSGDNLVPMGLLAESVKEVVRLNVDEMDPTPKVGIHLKPEFVQGIGRKNGMYFIILNLDRMLAATFGDDSHLKEETETDINE